MKLGAQQVERFLRQPSVPAVLVYGPDQGLVRERVERLVGVVLDDPKDPFRLTELSADALRGDPGRLLDEARALCLAGGRRVVRLRQASDQATAACRALLGLERLEALVVIDAGELGASSSLRRLIEGAPNAAALACYRDEGRDLGALVDRLLAEHDLEVEPEARGYLVEHLGADRGITRNEVAKLALYFDDPAADRPARRRVTLEDAASVVGDSAALDLDDLVHAATSGEAAQVERCLDRLLGEGQAPVRLLRALALHLGRLHQLACRVEGGESIDQAIDRARPPIHFRRRPSFKAALRRWPAARAGMALSSLLDAEIGCKTTGWPAAALCRRAVLGVCLAARAPTLSAG
ncbi:MAG TPA: DNA polymerase III subunit delta [Geminicoccaceae bacterium]|nr:DNA polymerase III subunit delta [Geminicoccaceae bacterium]